MEQAIYCGLIINELITNSFKYAFTNKEEKYFISLKKEDGIIRLIVSDDGIGYDKDTPTNSLGLTLVNTLAVNQLRGEIKIESINVVKTMISWKEDE